MIPYMTNLLMKGMMFRTTQVKGGSKHNPQKMNLDMIIYHWLKIIGFLGCKHAKVKN